MRYPHRVPKARGGPTTCRQAGLGSPPEPIPETAQTAAHPRPECAPTPQPPLSKWYHWGMLVPSHPPQQGRPPFGNPSQGGAHSGCPRMANGRGANGQAPAHPGHDPGPEQNAARGGLPRQDLPTSKAEAPRSGPVNSGLPRSLPWGGIVPQAASGTKNGVEPGMTHVCSGLGNK